MDVGKVSKREEIHKRTVGKEKKVKNKSQCQGLAFPIGTNSNFETKLVVISKNISKDSSQKDI